MLEVEPIKSVTVVIFEGDKVLLVKMVRALIT